MKEATGELSMTVVTIVAIVAIAGFITVVLWPRVSAWIEQRWNTLEGEAYVEVVDVDTFNM